MIRDMLVLPNMVIMLERQREQVELTSQLLKPLYLKVTDDLIASVNRDLSGIRMELQRRKIKIWTDDPIDFILYLRYVCRGYEHKFGATRDTIKTQIQLRLTEYVRKLDQAYQKSDSSTE